MTGYFMGMHRELHVQNFLQSNIPYAEFIGIPSNNSFNKAVKYIHDNKSWERCYVLLKNIFACLRAILLENSNHAVIERVYYYSRMTKQCIEKTISDIDYQELLPYLSSPGNRWNISDDRSDEEG